MVRFNGERHPSYPTMIGLFPMVDLNASPEYNYRATIIIILIGSGPNF